MNKIMKSSNIEETLKNIEQYSVEALKKKHMTKNAKNLVFELTNKIREHLSKKKSLNKFKIKSKLPKFHENSLDYLELIRDL
jgi:hypothetical protein